MPLTDTLAAVDDKRLRRLLAYWQGKCEGNRLPGRQHIDPVEFPYVLGWVSLIDVSHNPRRFRYRLFGSLIVERFGVDLTGRYLEDFEQPEFRAFLERAWNAVVDSRAPAHEFNNRVIDETRYEFETLRLPLASDGETVDMLLVASVHRR